MVQIKVCLRCHTVLLFKVKVKRKGVTENAEHACKVFDAIEEAAAEPLILERKLGEPYEQKIRDEHRRNAFERVAHNGDDRRHLAHRTKHVGKAGVAAAHVADVALALGDDLGDDDRRIDAAYQIGDDCRRQKQIPVGGTNVD